MKTVQQYHGTNAYSKMANGGLKPTVRIILVISQADRVPAPCGQHGRGRNRTVNDLNQDKGHLDAVPAFRCLLEYSLATWPD